MPLAPGLKEAFEKMEWTSAKPKEPEDPRSHLTGVNGINPMSPYDLPSSPTNFKDITDVVNRKNYSGYYPQSFAPVANYFLAFGLQPFFNPGEGEDYARGNLTIANMIELTATDQPWRLDRDQDIEEIFVIAKGYYDLISTSKVPEHQVYAKKVAKFLETLNKGYERMLKRTGKGPAPGVRSLSEILARIVRRK